MNQVAKLTGVFLVGALAGAACVFVWGSSKVAALQEIVSLAERARLFEAATAQYRKGDHRVAIYALSQALNAQENHLSSNGIHRRDHWDSALLHARLAKIHSQTGDSGKSKLHTERSIAAFEKMGWKLREAELWPALELIDKNKLREATQQYGVKNH